MVRQYGTPPSSKQQQEEERRYGRDRRDNEPKARKSDPYPSPKEVADAHRNADVDLSKVAIHHTLGGGPNQAAAGNHTHNGSDSPQLLAGVVLTGAKGGNTALASVISALTKLGATDSTTA